MRWSSYLRTKTRQPPFLWRMVFWILAIAFLLGLVAQEIWGPDQHAWQLPDRPETKAPGETLDTLAASGHWAELWWALPPVIYQRFTSPGPAGLALFAGVCWLVFLLHALRLRGWSDLRLWCTLVAIPLGVLSIWPTSFAYYWQEHAWNLHESAELIKGICYFVLGVGLREEAAKLLCLLPLMPILLRVRTDLAALLVSAAVGLGFAITENMGYFARSAGTEVMGRYLTANPAHMALTGVAGLALYRALRSPRDWGVHSLAMIGLMVIAHGMYDAFILVPALAEYGLFATIIFALVVYQFFGELRDARPTGGDAISLSATFLFGMSLTLGATFVYLSATLDCEMAFNVLIRDVVSLAVMVYLFLREMPETMVTV